MDDFETTVQQLVSECELDLAKLERRKATVDEHVASVQQEIVGLQAALRRYRVNRGIDDSGRIEVNEGLRQRFEGMATKDVLAAIFADAGGTVEGKDAYTVMVKAGMYNDDRGASNAFYRAMSRNPKIFQKVRRGVYQLADPSAKEWEGTLPPPEPLIKRTA